MFIKIPIYFIKTTFCDICNKKKPQKAATLPELKLQVYAVSFRRF